MEQPEAASTEGPTNEDEDLEAQILSETKSNLGSKVSVRSEAKSALGSKVSVRSETGLSKSVKSLKGK